MTPLIKASLPLDQTHGWTACHLANAIAKADPTESPYRHWYVRDMLPAAVVEALRKLPFEPLDLGGVSGRRELHNDARVYLSPEVQAEMPAAQETALAFQSPTVIAAIQRQFGAEIEGCRLRIEYARDIEGFWLGAHTDIGVKRFTLVLSLSDGPQQDHLGTDIFDGPNAWVARSPFQRNAGLIFLPAHDTWHGFERRPIRGVRKSLIVNYVTAEWRSVEQLAFPDEPVRAL